MRMLVISLLVLIATKTVWTDDRAELLNATLVARFHFAEQATDGQMVGAYQVSFRNTTEKPLTAVSILLNPGLRVDQVQGPGGARLQHTSRTATIVGLSPLELNAIDVRLPKPLTDKVGRFEIVIHYRGFLEDLSVAGLRGVKETLHPDFTMIRAQSFGYPVFASPEKASIIKAWNHKPFHQVAFLDIPGSNSVIGSLNVSQKTTKGAYTKFEMKSDNPTNLTMLAIAPFRIETHEAWKKATITDNNKQLEKTSRWVEALTKRFTDALGPAPIGQKIKLIEVPAGYNFYWPRSKGILFSGPSQNNPEPPTPVTIGGWEKILEGVANRVKGQMQDDRRYLMDARRKVFSIWLTNQSGRDGHWGNGLDSALTNALLGNIPSGNKLMFARASQLLEEKPLFAKVPIADLASESQDKEADIFSGLAFTVLNELLGEDHFFTLVRGLREELSAGYADMQSVAEYLDTNLRHRGAQKFAANWFRKGRIGKDMKKADSFDELVALYQ